MVWVVKLEEVLDGKLARRGKVATIDWPAVIESVDDIGLTIAEGKALLSSIQQSLVASQFEHDTERRAIFATCAQR